MISQEAKEHARHLLGNAAIDEIFQTIEDHYTEVWKGSSHKDTEVREDAYQMIRALHKLRTEIASIAKGDEIKAYNSRLASSTKMR